MLKSGPSPAGVQVIEIGQSLRFFGIGERRKDDRSSCQFCGFCCTDDTFVNLACMIVVGTEDKGALLPFLPGIFGHGNHVARIHCHQHRKAGGFVQGGGSGIALGKQHWLAVARCTQRKPVTGFLGIFQDAGILPAGDRNALVGAYCAVTVAERNNELIFVVYSHPRRSLNAFPGQVFMCRGLRPFVDIAAGIRGLSVVLCFQFPLCVLPALQRMRFQVKPCAGICLLSAGEGPVDRRIIRAAIIPVPAGRSAVQEAAICATFLPVFVTGGRNPVDFPVHGRQFFQNQSGIFQYLGKLGDRITAVHGDFLRSGQPAVQHGQVRPRAGKPEFVLFIPEDGCVPVHRGMRLFEIFYFICRHGKPGAVSGYRRHECFS